MNSARCIHQAALIVLCTICLALCMASGSVDVAFAGKNKTGKAPKLFGTLEFKGKIKKLPKWSGVLTKMKTSSSINGPIVRTRAITA